MNPIAAMPLFNNPRLLMGTLIGMGAVTGLGFTIGTESRTSRTEQLIFCTSAAVGAGLIGISIAKPGFPGAFAAGSMGGMFLGVGVGGLAAERFRGQWL